MVPSTKMMNQKTFTLFYDHIDKDAIEIDTINFKGPLFSL